MGPGRPGSLGTAVRNLRLDPQMLLLPMYAGTAPLTRNRLPARLFLMICRKISTVYKDSMVNTMDTVL
jgi:hypothetical protein